MDVGGQGPGPTTTPKDPAEELRAKLSALASADKLAIGHQESTAYGIGWDHRTSWEQEETRSDLKLVCGDFPAVHGWDLGDIGRKNNLDGVPFSLMRQHIQEAHARGGINTISWHMQNYFTGSGYWDLTPALDKFLPGSSHHEVFVSKLDQAADFFESLVDEEGAKIPLLLRPFHEHTGSWFWWGRDWTTDEDYIELFRFTVDYLRKERGQDQLLIAFSPDMHRYARVTYPLTEEQYLFRYPGDDYVDLFGVDFYWRPPFDNGGPEDLKDVIEATELAVRLAKSRGKVAALTEFGLHQGLRTQGVDVDTWYSKELLPALKASPSARGAAYSLFWRNASNEYHDAFIPYPGHSAEADFKAFCDDSLIVLESEVRGLLSESVDTSQ